ncbi:hypothetical protein GDO86_018809 [Hymenochirus boettgeri]|uniref:Uncharacterized protein n=1 Tax=Hymenochirus boettgeri TaxID=247094 RepID=A0A8T2IHG5_9PIPI|nr:hypothetical protein GDO86_018809 [Hymenochirus boettgeri]
MSCSPVWFLPNPPLGLKTWDPLCMGGHVPCTAHFPLVGLPSKGGQIRHSGQVLYVLTLGSQERSVLCGPLSNRE